MILADEPLTFTVTPDDIARGRAGSPWWCPVALALKRDHSDVSVTCSSIYIGDARWETPPSVADFITRFDLIGDPDPATFTLTTRVIQ